MRRAGTAGRYVRLTVVFAVLALVSCAKMGAPPGGPEDKTGPSVVSHYPDMDATNVPRRLIARLEFSEPVNHASVESALFLSPDPLQRLRYRWRGEVLELIYLDELEANRTYVISVGNQAKDLRGNPAGQTFTIAFSTGSVIDRGKIEGWITEVEAPQSVSIWAYKLDGDSTPDPTKMLPDYRMQPDDAGKIHLDYMRTGRYRVLAVTDKDHDGKWAPSSELIGIAPWDVAVTDSTLSWVSFKLSNQDTAPPSIRSVKDVHPQEIQLRLSAPVDTITAVRFIRGADTLGAVDQYEDLAEHDTWHVFPSHKLDAGPWTVSAAGISRFGAAWMDSESLTVRERADTTRPKVLTSDPPLKGRARSIRSALRLEFEEPVELDTGRAGKAVFVSSSRDTSSATIRQLAPRVVTATPDTAFISGSYTLWLNGEAIRDLAGNAIRDTTTDFRFGFYSPDSLGSLLVKFKGPAAGYILSLFEVKPHMLAERVLTGPGDVHFSGLEPARYTVEIVRDVNADSVYTYGRVTPWHFSDPYIVPADTIPIRARWTQEVDLTWPEQSP